MNYTLSLIIFLQKYVKTHFGKWLSYVAWIRLLTFTFRFFWKVSPKLSMIWNFIERILLCYWAYMSWLRLNLATNLNRLIFGRFCSNFICKNLWLSYSQGIWQWFSCHEAYLSNLTPLTLHDLWPHQCLTLHQSRVLPTKFNRHMALFFSLWSMVYPWLWLPLYDFWPH